MGIISMGFLEVFGKALEWEDSKIYIDKIRQSALGVLIQWIKSVKDKRCQPKFGYEFEFHKIHIDDENKKCLIDLNGFDEIKKSLKEENNYEDFITQFEFGKWMIEVVPKSPFKFLEPNASIDIIYESYDFMGKKFGKKSFLSISAFPILGRKEDFIFTDSENELGHYDDDKDFPVVKSFRKYPYNSNELVENNVFTKSKFI